MSINSRLKALEAAVRDEADDDPPLEPTPAEIAQAERELAEWQAECDRRSAEWEAAGPPPPLPEETTEP